MERSKLELPGSDREQVPARREKQRLVSVGIKRSSIGKALESLVANADVIDEDGKPRLTDPIFELWLRSCGLTPSGGGTRTSRDVEAR